MPSNGCIIYKMREESFENWLNVDRTANSTANRQSLVEKEGESISAKDANYPCLCMDYHSSKGVETSNRLGRIFRSPRRGMAGISKSERC
jgi:hypothetical protein